MTRRPSSKGLKTAMFSKGHIPTGEMHEEIGNHRSSVHLSPRNLQRTSNTPVGGNKRDWPEDLGLRCYKQHSGHTNAGTDECSKISRPPRLQRAVQASQMDVLDIQCNIKQGCGSHMVWEHSTTFPTKANSSGETGQIGKNVDRSDDVSQNQVNLA
ncbi:MAG: hypothetical protein OXC62_13925 [Aestuariivita sp.]|nr:hypothetical protein [Aestuariivita sp.]